MNAIIRRSPVVFNAKILEKELRGDWEVARIYANEGKGPFLIDLSHMPRWDFQDGNLDQLKPWDIPIPKIPGSAVFADKLLINRMNRTQASVWSLDSGILPAPDHPACTDMTDATVFLALLGKKMLSIAEKVSALDFTNAQKPDPFLLQGPLNHVPCQMVLIDRFSETPCMLLTCSRGYARDMTDGLLEAGREFSLAPAGEAVFSHWINHRQDTAS